MKKYILHVMISLALLFAYPAGAQNNRALPVTRIGVIVDGNWYLNQAIRTMVQNEVSELTSGEFEVEFPADKYIEGAWSQESVHAGMNRLLADPEVDVIFAMGVIASQDIALRGPLPKPVIAPFVIDVDLQDLPAVKGSSGVQNLNYIAIPSTTRRDVQTFLSIVPFQKLLMLVNGEVFDAIPQLNERFRQALDGLQVDPSIVPVYTLQDALNAINANVEAVYIAPLLQLPRDEFRTLIARINELKIPSFSLLGRIEVEEGILAGIKPDMFPKIARRVALNLQRILLGEAPGDIPYAFSAGEELCFNMATARQIGVYPDWALITEAVLLNDQRTEVAQHWALQSAVLEGLRVNQDLLAKSREVAAGQQNIGTARANLLPQIDLSATAVQIDADRAGTFQAEQTVSGSATLTQVLFSDDAWANLSVQQSLQRSLEQEYGAERLNIAQHIATAYLQVLNAKTLERVQKENLKLSRSNLELARVRESVGFSGRSEVYRWESQIASNRQAVINANSLRNIAEIQFNRVLNRPLEEKFSTRETGMEDEGLLSEQGRLFRYMANPVSFKILRTFFVSEGLANSPELQQLGAAIAAQERILKNANRSLVLPTLAAQAQLSRIFLKEGEGSEPTTLPPGDPLAPLLESFSTGNNTNWSVALNMSFPLYNGGAKYAARKKALEILNQLRYEQASLREKIEQRIRSAGHTVGASFAGIRQSRDAADAAGKNLDLVIDAYSQGVLSVTDLLEAQNASLVADQAAARAVFDFLIDLMELERSTGQLHVLRIPEEKAAYFERVERYFEEAGFSLRR